MQPCVVLSPPFDEWKDHPTYQPARRNNWFIDPWMDGFGHCRMNESATCACNPSQRYTSLYAVPQKIWHAGRETFADLVAFCALFLLLPNISDSHAELRFFATSQSWAAAGFWFFFWRFSALHAELSIAKWLGDFSARSLKGRRYLCWTSPSTYWAIQSCGI